MVHPNLMQNRRKSNLHSFVARPLSKKRWLWRDCSYEPGNSQKHGRFTSDSIHTLWRGLLTIYNSGGGTSLCACGTSPSSLPILLVCLTFPVVLSLFFSSSSSDFPCPPPNQLVEYLEAFGFGIKSVVFGMRRMWYERVAAGEVRSQSSRRAKFRRLDLNRLSRKSPIRGTMPTTQSIRTLKS